MMEDGTKNILLTPHMPRVVMAKVNLTARFVSHKKIENRNLLMVFWWKPKPDVEHHGCPDEPEAS